MKAVILAEVAMLKPRDVCVLASFDGGLVECGGFVGSDRSPIWVVWVERDGVRVSIYAIPDCTGGSLCDDRSDVCIDLMDPRHDRLLTPRRGGGLPN